MRLTQALLLGRARSTSARRGARWLRHLRLKWHYALGCSLSLVALLAVRSYVTYDRWSEYWSRADNPSRDQSPLTQAVLNAARPAVGMHLADLGAGGGYFTFRFARAVGPHGRVYATDTDWHMVSRLWHERLRRGTSWVSPRLVSAHEVGLAPASVDVVVMVNVYRFHPDAPVANRTYLAEVARALRPGGRFILAEDFVHGPRWVSARGLTDRRGTLPPDEIVRAAPGLREVSREALQFPHHLYTAQESLGFLLVLQKPDVGGR